MQVSLFCIGNGEARMLQVIETDTKPHHFNIKFNISVSKQHYLSCQMNTINLDCVFI